MWQIDSVVDGLSWPSISFAILVGSLLLSMYVLWRRFRSRRALMLRVAELETLSAAGRSLVASELDMTALCELIASESGKVIDNQTFQVGLFDGDNYTIMFWTIEGQKQETPKTFNLSEDEGVVGWMRESKRPLLVRDFLREMDSLPAKPRYVSHTPPRSAIFIPLVSGEVTIGIVASQSKRPGRFNEEDMRRLMILANQSAAAMANALMFEQLQRRASHLEMVGNIARQINSAQSQQEIFDQVVSLVRERFGFHPVSILSLNAQTNQLELKASSSALLISEEMRIGVGEGIIGSAAASRQTIVSNNTAEDDRFMPHVPGKPATTVATNAEMAIPLIVDNEVLGVLDVQSSRGGVFTEAETMALDAVAAETAIAIDKARQLMQQREQAWVTTAQLQMAEAIDRNGDLDETLHTITRLTTMLVGVKECGILLWDEEMSLYRGGSLHTPDRNRSAVFERTRLSVGDWGPLDAVHVGQSVLTTTKMPPWFQKSPPQADYRFSLFPLFNRDQARGVMLVTEVGGTPGSDGTLPASTTMQRRELLQNISLQATLAIESAMLRNAQQEEAWVNTVLLQVAEAVNSLIDLNEILSTIVRMVPMLVGVQSVVVLVWDEETKTFRAGPSHGITSMGRGMLETHGIEEDEFLELSARNADFITPTAVYYSLRLPEWLVKVLGAPSAHAFPLNARGRLVGTMLVGTSLEAGHSFSVRRLNILNGIAHQAATAVVNNQLYQESAERSRLEQELDVARKIQASLIPSGSPDIPGCSVSSYWQAARQVSGDFYDFIQLPEGGWGIVIADVADKGVPAALYMTLSRTVLRTVALNRRNPADVLMRANRILDADSQSDLFVTAFYAIWDPVTGHLFYANGGHNPPLLLRASRDSYPLPGRGMALGVLPKINIESHAIQIEPGDTLLFYTDGVTEAMNLDYAEFGIERLTMAAEAARDQDAAGIKQSITQAISEHVGGTPQSDDITLVVMKRAG